MEYQSIQLGHEEALKAAIDAVTAHPTDFPLAYEGQRPIPKSANRFKLEVLEILAGMAQTDEEPC